MAVATGRDSVASQTQTLKVGDPAPTSSLPGHRSGEKFKLSDQRGKKNVVHRVLSARLDPCLNRTNAGI